MLKTTPNTSINQDDRVCSPVEESYCQCSEPIEIQAHPKQDNLRF